MQQNIVELAKNEIISYIGSLDTSKTFKTITEKYTELHNKGIFINFTFNSSDATGLFGSFGHFYNFPIETYINPSFNRYKILHFSEMEKKQKRKIDSLEKELEHIRKVRQNFRSFSKNLDLDLSKIALPETLTPEFIINAFNSNDFLNFTSSIFSQRESFMKEKVSSKRKTLSYIRKAEQNVRYVEIELKQVELEFFKVVLKKFFSIIESLTTLLFGNKKVIVTYSEKEWVKFYSESRNRSANFYSRNDNLSNFEYFMVHIIEENIEQFQIKIFVDKYVFDVSKSNISTNLVKKPVNKIQEQLDELYNQFKLFRKQYPEFAVGISTINELARKFELNDPTLLNVATFLKQNYSTNIMEEYDTLVKQIQEKEKEKHSPEPYINLPNFYQTFSDLSFDIKQEKDMAYWYGLKQEKYNDIIQSISNDEYVLSYSIEKEINQ